MKIRKIVLYAIITSIYVAVSLLLGPFSFGPIQFRLAEILMIFCVIDAKFVIPLTIGCLLSNAIGVALGYNLMALDIVFGSIGTLLSGILMYKLSHIRLFKKPLLSFLIPCFVNALIVGIELTIYMGGASQISTLLVFLYNFITIFLGEFISVFFFGLVFEEPFRNIAMKERKKFGL